MLQHKAPVSGIASFLDQFVATAGYDNRVLLWDASSRKALAMAFHDHLVNQCRFSGCGRYLVTASSDHTARLWSVPDLKLLSVFAEHRDDVEMAVIDSRRRLVATASRDHGVRLFDFSGALKFEGRGHEADVLSVEWSDDGSELITSSDDGTIRRWCVKTGRLLETVSLQGVETDTIAIAKEKTIYAGNDAGEIITIRGGLRRGLKAHRAGVKRLVYDRQSARLVSLSYDRTLRLYRDLPQGLEFEGSADLPSVVWPRSAAFLGGAKLVFGTFGSGYAEYDLNARSWNIAGVDPTHGINAVAESGSAVVTVGDAGLVRLAERKGPALGSLCNFLLPYGRRVITGGQSGEIFDALTGETLYRHSSPLNCGASFTRGGRPSFVIGAYTGEGLVFDEKSGRVRLRKIVKLHENAIKGICADRSRLFSVCATGAAAIHSIESLRLLKHFEKGHEKISNGCDALGDGHFVSVSRDLKLRIWDRKGARVIKTPHSRSIKCVRVDKPGRRIATGSYNGEVHVYDRSLEKWVHSSRPTTSGISSLSAARAGGFWASSYDGSVYRVQ